MRIQNALMFASLGLFFLKPGWAAPCRFELDPSSVQVSWTAFKTTEKVAVKGSLKEVKVQNARRASTTVPQALSQLKARVAITGEGSSQSGNPARDTTLYRHFFKHLAGQGGIRGQVVSAQGGPESGELRLRLVVSGKQREVPFKYTRTADGVFLAKGAIDILDFGAKKAFEDIHGACENLHRGADGISKTWSEVEVEIAAKITGDCTS
jgi:hypothetical protein